MKIGSWPNLACGFSFLTPDLDIYIEKDFMPPCPLLPKSWEKESEFKVGLGAKSILV